MSNQQQRDLAGIASALDAVVGPDGAQALEALRLLVHRATLLPPGSEEALTVLAAVESELDDIPGPTQYGQWSPAKLRERLIERDAYLVEAKASLQVAVAELKSNLDLERG